MQKISVNLAQDAYQIAIGNDLLTEIVDWSAYIPQSSGLIVTHARLWDLHHEKLTGLMQDHNFFVHIVPEGESFKTLASCEQIWQQCAQNNIRRDACIVAFGGGVIGDLAGFSAACWMRGIAFIQIPSTLLAMVDSSVGGKTGVNIQQAKNAVGAFYQPQTVLIDPALLSTLPCRDLCAGFAEIVKYAAIADVDFFGWLTTHAHLLLQRDAQLLELAITRSCQHKVAIVQRDEKEQNDQRALLNFGHTFAHAIESVTAYKDYKHGEAVAIGMVMAARLSAQWGLSSEADTTALVDLLQCFQLPTSLLASINRMALYQAMQHDKKHDSQQLKLILWRGIGQAEVFTLQEAEKLQSFLLDYSE